jgi:hypothetical protein
VVVVPLRKRSNAVSEDKTIRDAEAVPDEEVIPYEGMPLSEATKKEAYKRYIEIWTKAMDPFQTSPYEVRDANTSFRKAATEETLEDVVREAIAVSDRVWGKV